MKYKIIDATCLFLLEKQVNKWMKVGWQPLGGVQVYHTESGYKYCVQALTWYAENDVELEWTKKMMINVKELKESEKEYEQSLSLDLRIARK